MRGLTVFGAALLAAAAPAAAISVANPADLFNGNSLVAAGQFSGVVGLQIQSKAGAAAACTGTMIGSNTVLTAAHCLTLDGSGIAAVRAVFGDLTTNPVTGMLNGTTDYATAYHIDPSWNGVAQHGSDIAIIKLSSNAPRGTTIYKTDTGTVASDLGVQEMVGLGAVGTGASGTIGFDGQKRYGFNTYQFTFDQVLAGAGFGTPPSFPTDAFGAPKGSELAYDFTGGNPTYDVFGRFLGAPSGPGYVTVGGVNYSDTLATAGDSGAPHFENGKIVGVTSFGISGSLFQMGACGGPTSVDPSHSATSCTNSSFGEIGVDTRVASFASFVASYVPEPASWTMLIAGFGVVGIAARRRRFVEDRQASA